MKDLLTILAVLVALASCDGKTKPAEPIRYDGSSTVYPITRELADRFGASSSMKFMVSAGGTGAGVKKLCRGELDLAGASRDMKPSEVKACERAQVDWIQLPIARDGIAVVVHPSNDWVDQMTTAELEAIWSDSAADEVSKWSDVRKGWPSKPINLYGPGLESGTYDYFNTVILNGEASRSDYDSSESDTVIMSAVADDPNGLGYFSLAYAKSDSEAVRTIPIDDGNDDNGVGAVPPALETIAKGSYQPLSRPVFIFVSKTSVARPEVAAFIDFYLDGVPAIAEEAGFAPLSPKEYAATKRDFEQRVEAFSDD